MKKRKKTINLENILGTKIEKAEKILVENTKEEDYLLSNLNSNIQILRKLQENITKTTNGRLKLTWNILTQKGGE